MAGDPRRPGRRRRRRDPAPVSGMLDRYLRGRGAGRGPVAAAPAGMETLTAAWRAVAGRDAAGSLPLRRTRNGIVTVACADAGIAQALSAREDDLVDALRAATGEQVRGLRCVVADHALPPAEDAPPPPPRPPGAQASAVAEGLVASVEDPALRAAIARAAARSIQRTWDG